MKTDQYLRMVLSLALAVVVIANAIERVKIRRTLKEVEDLRARWVTKNATATNQITAGGQFSEDGTTWFGGVKIPELKPGESVRIEIPLPPEVMQALTNQAGPAPTRTMQPIHKL